MIVDRLAWLICPKCKQSFELKSYKGQVIQGDLLWGEIDCKKCKQIYPVIDGVLILLENVRAYLQEHAEALLSCAQIDKLSLSFQKMINPHKGQRFEVLSPEDLESLRVTALYALNHYLKWNQISQSLNDNLSPQIRDLGQKYWDQSPDQKVADQLSQIVNATSDRDTQLVLELGCNVGGMHEKLKGLLKTEVMSLGLDTSFMAIKWARHVYLGGPWKGKLQWSGDRFLPALNLDSLILSPRHPKKHSEFIVADMLNPPVQKRYWDVVLSMNVIDMLPRPEKLISSILDCVKIGGMTVGASPYIWPENFEPETSVNPNEKTKKMDSKQWLNRQFIKKAQKLGLKLLPIETLHGQESAWMFLKTSRQIELYVTSIWANRVNRI